MICEVSNDRFLTIMETKQTIKEVMTFWKDAMTSHKDGNYAKSLEQYGQIEEKSGRIYYNMGCAYIKLNQHAEAIKCFTMSIEKDKHSAVSHFQRGVLYLNGKRFYEAMSDFMTSQKLFRGNTFINYTQLGMRCKLHLCEVLYNMALTNILKGEESRAEKLLIECRNEIENKHRHQISAAHEYLQGRVTMSELLHPITISADLIFSPPKDVIDNLNRRNVPRMARVVSSSNFRDSDPSFDGQQRVEELKVAELQKCLEARTTPLKAVGRFLKNPAAKRDRSKSQASLIGEPGMKGSQSMNDIRVRSKSHGILPDIFTMNIFPNKRKKSISTHSLHKSASDQQFIKNSFSKSGYQRKRRESMGSIFGNTLSPVNTALSKTFDILTAIVVPVDINSGFSPIGLDHEHISRNSSISTDLGEDDVSDVFIDSSNTGESLSETFGHDTLETRSSDFDNHKCVFEIGDSSNSTNSLSDSESVDVQSDHISIGSETENLNTVRDSPRRRKIPPPPSYPPPPLPPNVVIFV